MTQCDDRGMLLRYPWPLWEDGNFEVARTEREQGITK
jgi:hypothetical protein